MSHIVIRPIQVLFTDLSVILNYGTIHAMTASSYSELLSGLSGLSPLGVIVLSALGVYMVYWYYILKKRSLSRNLKLDIVASTRFSNTHYRNVMMNIENRGKKTAKNIRIILFKINFKEDGKGESTIKNVSEKGYLKSGESYSAEIFDMNDNELKLAGESHKRQSVSFNMFISGDNFTPINTSIRYVDKTDLFRGEVVFARTEGIYPFYPGRGLVR